MVSGLNHEARQREACGKIGAWTKRATFVPWSVIPLCPERKERVLKVTLMDYNSQHALHSYLKASHGGHNRLSSLAGKDIIMAGTPAVLTHHCLPSRWTRWNFNNSLDMLETTGCNPSLSHYTCWRKKWFLHGDKDNSTEALTEIQCHFITINWNTHHWVLFLLQSRLPY